MLFFLDENFPKRAVSFLNEKGHETLDLRGTPEEGLSDSLTFDIAPLQGKFQADFLLFQ
jgi:predicted nuclease of predicted toxin-antitoxin system